MSQLYKVANGFDSISGAAFGGGGGGGGGGGSARSPINSHPSAMSSSQYNNAYTPPGGATCMDQVALGAFGSSIAGASGGPLGMVYGGATSYAIGAAVCKAYD